MPAALAAECAGEQGGFWQMHDLIFDDIRNLQDEDLDRMARQIEGVKIKKYRRCYVTKRFQDKVDGDKRMADRFGARGTPSFFINGRFFSGAQPIERFRKLIDEELAKAKASGTPRADYYRKHVLKN